MLVETYLTCRELPTPASQLNRCGARSCKSEDIFSFDGDVFCNECGWNSIEARVAIQAQLQTESWKRSKERPENRLVGTMGHLKKARREPISAQYESSTSPTTPSLTSIYAARVVSEESLRRDLSLGWT